MSIGRTAYLAKGPRLIDAYARIPEVRSARQFDRMYVGTQNQGLTGTKYQFCEIVPSVHHVEERESCIRARGWQNLEKCAVSAVVWIPIP